MLEALVRNSPYIDATTVLNTGVSELQDVFSGETLAAVRDAYMVGIKDVFAFSMAGAAFLTLLTFAIPFKRMPLVDGQDTEDAKNTDKKEATVNS